MFAGRFTSKWYPIVCYPSAQCGGGGADDKYKNDCRLLHPAIVPAHPSHFSVAYINHNALFSDNGIHTSSIFVASWFRAVQTFRL